jgi:hypothetical protein
VSEINQWLIFTETKFRWCLWSPLWSKSTCSLHKRNHLLLLTINPLKARQTQLRATIKMLYSRLFQFKVVHHFLWLMHLRHKYWVKSQNLLSPKKKCNLQRQNQKSLIWKLAAHRNIPRSTSNVSWVTFRWCERDPKTWSNLSLLNKRRSFREGCLTGKIVRKRVLNPLKVAPIACLKSLSLLQICLPRETLKGQRWDKMKIKTN